MGDTIGDNTRETSVSFEITASEIIKNPASVRVPCFISTEPIVRHDCLLVVLN